MVNEAQFRIFNVSCAWSINSYVQYRTIQLHMKETRSPCFKHQF